MVGCQELSTLPSSLTTESVVEYSTCFNESIADISEPINSFRTTAKDKQLKILFKTEGLAQTITLIHEMAKLLVALLHKSKLSNMAPASCSQVYLKLSCSEFCFPYKMSLFWPTQKPVLIQTDPRKHNPTHTPIHGNAIQSGESIGESMLMSHISLRILLTIEISFICLMFLLLDYMFAIYSQIMGFWLPLQLDNNGYSILFLSWFI